MNARLSAVRVIKKAVLPQGSEIQNTLLLSLPAVERNAVFPKLEDLTLPIHTVLNETGDDIEFAYFLNDGLASFLTVMEDGKSVEVGLCGREGFVGTGLAAGFKTSPMRVIIQVAGNGSRITASDLRTLLPKCPFLQTALQRFAQQMGLQAMQVAACNRLHDIDERLARWLLMSQDRLGGDQVPLTQDFLAHMLGTRRASVTVAAGILQKAGLISYNRGKVTIRNREMLEDACCECYDVIKERAQQWQSEGNSPTAKT